jgi:hypothetical protein
MMASQEVHRSRSERDYPATTSLRRGCRGMLRMPDIGREVSRPYRVALRISDFFKKS